MSEEFDEENEVDVKKFFSSSTITRNVSEALTKSGYVDSGTSAAKLAISYALAIDGQERLPQKISDRAGFNLGITQFDPNGSVKTLIKEVCFPNSEVTHRQIYDLAELLCEFGMIEIQSQLESGNTIVQIITEIS